MSNKLQIKDTELTFKKLTFIETMGLKRVVEPIIMSIYDRGEEKEMPNRKVIRDRFYNQSEETFNDIIKVLGTAITKINRKTKLKDSDIEDLLSTIDIEDILYIMNILYNGNISLANKKK